MAILSYMQNRLFLSQQTLDEWLSDGRAKVDGDDLTLTQDAQRFSIKSAVYFQSEVTGAGDAHRLLGRVKDLDQIAALGGDYASGTVIVGDFAYEVTDGFVGTAAFSAKPAASGETMASALGAAAGSEPKQNELDALAKLFLSSSKK